MSGPPFYNNTTNPNAGGGVNSPDSRTGLGIASLGGDPNSRLGKEYQGMGDALSSPKGPYDVVDEEELEASNNKKKNKDKEKFKLDIEDKISLSLKVQPTDSLSYKGTDTSYFSGLGNSIASVIAAGESINGNLVAEQQLKEYIKEALLLEISKSSISSSGRIAALSSDKGNNLGGDPYGKSLGSTNTADAAPPGHLPVNRHGNNSKGYGQKQINVKIKGANNHIDFLMKPTTDGSKTVFGSDLDEEAYCDDNDSTYNILDKTSSKEFYDQENVNKHKRRRFNQKQF